MPMEKETVTHSSILAWKTPGSEGPGGLQSTGSQSVRHDWVTSLHFITIKWASLVAQLVKKNLPAMQETWIQSLSWEDPLEKGKATHSSILAWRIPWTAQRVRPQWAACTSTSTFIAIQSILTSLRIWATLPTNLTHVHLFLSIPCIISF